MTGMKPSAEEFIQAVRRGDLPEVIGMVQRGASMNEKSRGMTPLIWAAANGHHQTLQYLLRHGARVDDKNSLAGDTALHRAASGGHKRLVEDLLEHGAAIDSRNDQGDTPLMAAISNGKMDVVRLLLQKGADVTLRNKGYENALSIAKKTKRDDAVIALLEETQRLREQFASTAARDVIQKKQEGLKTKAAHVRWKPGSTR